MVKVTTTDVNLRKGPGLSYAVLSVLPGGTRVTTTGKTSRGYAEVISGSVTGWASTQYLAGAATGLPAVIGTRVATADLSVRTTSRGRTPRTWRGQEGHRALGDRRNPERPGADHLPEEGPLGHGEVSGESAGDAPDRRPGLPKITGSRYATAELNVRSTYADKYTLIAVVPIGTKLSITGVVKNARMQIVYNNAARWVTAKYLSKSKPSTTTPPSWKAVERGLQPNAIKVHRAARAAFPQIVTYYTVRRDPISDHP